MKPLRLAPSISVIIKAFNEEGNIAAAIESAIAAVDGTDGEIILADCLSTDRTVEIARRYPITIVSLKNGSERSCGAGAQLGFQYSNGRYVCIMDGDMRLCSGFLAAAIAYLDGNPDIAGVGGLIVECEAANLEFVKRRQNQDRNFQPGQVNRLDCGGVYRRAAIEAVNYLADRNLHGGEELDLGGRLYVRGEKLVRLDRPGVMHQGHAGSAYRLLLRRWTSRVAFGAGELIRAAIGQPQFRFLITANKSFVLWWLVQLWWLCLLVLPFAAPGVAPKVATFAALLIAPIAAMALRLRSLKLGLYSVAAWNVYALAFWPGFFRRRIPPTAWIDSVVVQTGRQMPARLRV